ncbi:hypothetical protein [Kribbella lupini]
MTVRSAPAIAGRRGPRTAPAGTGGRVSLRSLLEAGGAAAAVLYVILSIYYDKFYSRLGIEPSDVGLDRTAVISRAVGGVVALICTLFVVGVVYSQLLLAYSFVVQRWTQHFFQKAFPHSKPDLEKLRRHSRFAGALISATLTERPSMSIGRKRSAILAGLLSLLFLAFILRLSWTMVDRAATSAATGRVVRPLTFLGLRVLDVESRPCTAQWLGSAETRPAALNSPDLHCLGTANGTAVFRQGATTITIPAGQVVITLLT